MKQDYKQYFIYGAGLLVAGILLTLKFKFECVFVLFGTGIAYLIIGLVKWNKRETLHTEGNSDEKV